MMHVDEAMAARRPSWPRSDHAFHVLKLGSLYFNVDSLSRHGFPWPLDAKEMAPFWARLAELGIVLCLELSSGPTYDMGATWVTSWRWDGSWRATAISACTWR